MKPSLIAKQIRIVRVEKTLSATLKKQLAVAIYLCQTRLFVIFIEDIPRPPDDRKDRDDCSLSLKKKKN